MLRRLCEPIQRTVAALLTASVVLRGVWLLGLGAYGVIVFVPPAATRCLPESVGAPLARLTIGLILLGITLWLARSRKTPPSR